MSFWVYENWRSGSHRAVVHTGSCGHCKDGLGRSGHGTSPADGRWLGPFDSPDDAVACVETLKPMVLRLHRCCESAAELLGAPTRVLTTRRFFARPTNTPAGSAEGPLTIDFLLLGSTLKQAAHPAKAKDLYSSTRFAKRRAYAEATGKPWALLSARHGLVQPDEVLSPYDLSLESLSSEQRTVWADRVVAQLVAHLGSLDGKVFELLASRLYGAQLEPRFAREGAQLLSSVRRSPRGEVSGW